MPLFQQKQIWLDSFERTLKSLCGASIASGTTLDTTGVLAGTREFEKNPTEMRWGGGKALPDFIALVLVADGQKIQQNFVEVAQSEVNAHNCYCVPGGHLGTGKGGR